MSLARLRDGIKLSLIKIDKVTVDLFSKSQIKEGIF